MFRVLQSNTMPCEFWWIQATELTLPMSAESDISFTNNSLLELVHNLQLLTVYSACAWDWQWFVQIACLSFVFYFVSVRGYLGVKEQAGTIPDGWWHKAFFLFTTNCVKSELTVLSKGFHPVSFLGNSFVGAIFAMATISLHWEWTDFYLCKISCLAHLSIH